MAQDTPQDTGSRPQVPPPTQSQLPPDQDSKQPPQRATITDAWRTIKPDDFLSVHQTPCSRQGFLTGIGSGFAIGFLRFVLGAPVPKAANWAVGGAMAGAVAQYEFCQWRRRQEREKMKRVVEVYDRKQGEMRAMEEAERRRREQEEEREGEREKERARRRWYKFW